MKEIRLEGLGCLPSRAHPSRFLNPLEVAQDGGMMTARMDPYARARVYHTGCIVRPEENGCIHNLCWIWCYMTDLARVSHLYRHWWLPASKRMVEQVVWFTCYRARRFRSGYDVSM